MTTARSASRLNLQVICRFRSKLVKACTRLAALCLSLLTMAAGRAEGQSLDWVNQAGGTFITGGYSAESAAAVAVDSLGNSYITGTFRTQATFGAGEPNRCATG
jgi:hypothetical protein